MQRLGIILLLTITACLPVSAAEKPAKTPPPGTVFSQKANAPKYVTSDIEFRDPAGTRWPNFAYGKPSTDGQLTFDAKQPKINLTMKLDQGVQLKGDQSRRVLGALIVDEKFPHITVKLNKATAFEMVKMEREEKGKMVQKDVEVMPVSGELIIGDRTVPFKGVTTIEYKTDKNKSFPNWLILNTRMEINGNALGLTDQPMINIRISTTVYAD